MIKTINQFKNFFKLIFLGFFVVYCLQSGREKKTEEVQDPTAEINMTNIKNEFLKTEI